MKVLNFPEGNLLISFLRDSLPKDLGDRLSDAELMSLSQGGVWKTYEKDEVVHEMGSSRQKVYFVWKGRLRYSRHSFALDNSVSLWFPSERYIAFGGWEHYFTEQESRFGLEAIRKSTVLEFDARELGSFIVKHVKNGEILIYRKVFELLGKILIFFLNRVGLKPEEHYLELINDPKVFPLLEELNDSEIATMLGITHVSFSRLKKRLKDKKTQKTRGNNL